MYPAKQLLLEIGSGLSLAELELGFGLENAPEKERSRAIISIPAAKAIMRPPVISISCFCECFFILGKTRTSRGYITRIKTWYWDLPVQMNFVQEGGWLQALEFEGI